MRSFHHSCLPLCLIRVLIHQHDIIMKNWNQKTTTTMLQPVSDDWYAAADAAVAVPAAVADLAA
jgi:hypothetical protein